MVNITSIFINGYLVKTEPPLNDYYKQRDCIYHSKHIVSDGVKYNLEDINSIESIIVPSKFTEICWKNMGITGYLDYVLRMKASTLRNNKENELSIALLKKTFEIMYASPISWQEKDYRQIIVWLYEDGRFDEGDFYKDLIEKLKITSFDFSERSRQQHIDQIKEIGSDLVLATKETNCCPECAKYRNRVYSISGKSNIFPKIPKYRCSCYGLFFSYYDPEITHINFTQDIVSYSNRPYIDDRTTQERDEYSVFVNQINKDKKYIENQRMYYQLKYMIPDIAPKSFNAFMKMKNSNSTGYQKLKMVIKEKGILL